ncbi:MAG: hypothetical protein PUC09_03515 [Methanobrevibacter wolinii]|nr:hypothetical protein [Methanobrevibacter wolinii]
MSKKIYITDCEGPLTLNDNAFEMCSYFIEDGDKLYKILSSYDDYLVEVEKKRRLSCRWNFSIYYTIF